MDRHDNETKQARHRATLFERTTWAPGIGIQSASAGALGYYGWTLIFATMASACVAALGWLVARAHDDPAASTPGRRFTEKVEVSTMTVNSLKVQTIPSILVWIQAPQYALGANVFSIAMVLWRRTPGKNPVPVPNPMMKLLGYRRIASGVIAGEPTSVYGKPGKTHESHELCALGRGVLIARSREAHHPHRIPAPSTA